MIALQQKLGDRLLHNEPLAKYTAARLGGPADWLYIARESLDELAEVVQTAWQQELPVRVLGGGANVLISEQGVRGLVVINKVSAVEFDGLHVTVASGTALSTLAQRCQKRGLSGLEWAVSVPGTVGGAVVNNAGAHGGDMASVLVSALVATPTGQARYTNAVLDYDYRHSALKVRPDRRFLVLSAELALQQDEPSAIADRMAQYVAHRKRTQPPGASLGSIFKNPPNDYAGRLIEAAGLKGYRIGDAQVSPVHANFFINLGDATASDYYVLIQHVRKVVEEQFGVKLEMEVECVGEWD